MIIRSLLALAALAMASATMSAADIQPVPAYASKRVATVQVRVAPDHPDWTYRVGEPARFTIHATADNIDLVGQPITVAYGPEQMKETVQKVTVPAGGLVIDAGTMKEPGFLRVNVTAEVQGFTYKGAAAAAYEPEKIQPTQTEPADFDAFWAGVKKEVADLPLEVRLTLQPDACTAAVNVYHVSVRLPGGSWQGPSQFFGILCEPVKPGKYPALLRVPGAGVRPYKGDIGTAEKGAITFEVGIHGVPVNMPQSVYDALHSGGLLGYQTFNLDDREKFYYRRVIQGCLKSVEFLASRPGWNGKDLVISGASQGGMLSIITTALDSRITGLSVTHPAFCDVSGNLHGRAGGWPQPFRGDVNTGAPSANATPAKILTASYYDVVNFAKRVKVPGHYIWGFVDDACPPTSTFSAYNVITAKKELNLVLEQGHTYIPEQSLASQGWIEHFLGLTK